jgi:alpha-L-rhamnosidase
MSAEERHVPRPSLVDPRTRTYVWPDRIAWQQGEGLDAAKLLAATPPQSAVNTPPLLVLRPGDPRPGFLLDFGEELHGSVQITLGKTDDHKPGRLRVRFGESYTEAMGEPNQDHAVHDQLVQAAWLGTTEVGQSGFRFVRIDLADDATAAVEVQGVRAVSLMRPLEQLGSFQCSDDRLNRIWQVGARTVHLCMQDYLWDGVKRDRLVWIGDMHPEAAVVSAVFGEVDVVPASLDFARDECPLPGWMNGISSYSLWWVIVHRDWYLRYGRLDYLAEQKPYLLGLVELLLKQIDDKGRETMPDMRFLDWPTSGDAVAVHAGLQALLTLGLSAAATLCDALREHKAAGRCKDAVVRLRRHVLAAPGVKQANALLALAGLYDPVTANRNELARDPLSGLSTFYGYYVLQARALAGDLPGCLDVIRQYWGGMLDRGATTFWEDFDLAWLEGSGRIDAATPPGKKDLHADFGGYCYTGLRHSLCHGWAAGPTAWLSEHVLGVTPLAAGFTKARVSPQTVGLEWVRGTYPTPHGPIRVEVKRTADGTPQTTVDVPKGVERVRE